MQKILFTFMLFSLSFLSRSALAQSKIHKGFVKLADGVERYVEYSAPQGNKPWIVMTNGLVYELERWGSMDEELRRQGFGLVHYYFRGQDWTLNNEVDQFGEPSFFQTGFELKDFALEIKQILEQLKIKDRVIVVGLSYGAHAAATFAEQYPEKVEELIFLAPLVVPLERYQPQGAWLDWNLAWVKALWGPYFYEYAYRQIYGSYLETRVSPDRVPEHLSDIPEIYKESLFHLVRVTRDFDLKDYKFETLKKNSVFFMVAQEDTPLAFNDQIAAFDGVDENSQGAMIWLPDSSHAIPDSEPQKAARYLQHIIDRDPRLEQGKKYKSTSRGLTHW
jgi:pimeloyl-ACP methyl ester carboxylesterase